MSKGSIKGMVDALTQGDLAKASGVGEDHDRPARHAGK